MTRNTNAIRNAIEMIAGALVVCAAAAGCGKSEARSEDVTIATPVKTGPAREMTFTREVQLQGTLESVRFALVPAESEGTIERIMVAEGDHVTKGQPLAEIDSETLQRVVT